MSRFEQRLAGLRQEQRSGLVTYVTAGDPQAGSTLDALRTLSAAGTDLIELGMPFSDPMADGPVLQAASERALANGTTLDPIFSAVRSWRLQDPTTPLILMGYSNPVWQRGIEPFCRQAAEAGVDGLLLVDLPAEHDGPLRQTCAQWGLLWPRMVTPGTSPERLQRIAAQASGFLYLVSDNGVTGTTAVPMAGLGERLNRARAATQLPLAVGFGLKTPQQLAQLNGQADWLVVGSALHERLSRCATPALGLAALQQQVQALRSALVPLGTTATG